MLCAATGIAMLLAALGVMAVTDDGRTAHASASVPPYDADTIAVSEIDGGVYAIIINNVYIDTDDPKVQLFHTPDNGIRIINITDPSTPTQIVNILPNTTSRIYSTAVSITTTEIHGKTYAVVGGVHNHGVHIINITDPTAPNLVARLDSGRNGFINETWMAVASAISEVDGETHMVVTNHYGGSIQIVNITNPALPTLTAEMKQGSWADRLPQLSGAAGVETVKIAGHTYAIVASYHDDAIVVVRITDPANPVRVINAIDGVKGFTELNGAWSVAITEISNRVYAVVASRDDDGVQIIDITNPAGPVPTAAMTSDTRRTTTGYSQLGAVIDVETAEISGRHYAVASSLKGVQIIDITNPSSPAPVVGIQYYSEEVPGSAIRGIEITEISGRTYVVAASLYDDDVQIIDITDPAIPSQLSVKP